MVSLRQLGKQNRPEDMHPADVDRLIDLSEESAAAYRERIKMGEPSLEHQKRFRCALCDRPLGYGLAGGIGSKSYHPACAEKESAAMRERNLKHAAD